jgi:hypothetical protein
VAPLLAAPLLLLLLAAALLHARLKAARLPLPPLSPPLLLPAGLPLPLPPLPLPLQKSPLLLSLRKTLRLWGLLLAALQFQRQPRLRPTHHFQRRTHAGYCSFHCHTYQHYSPSCLDHLRWWQEQREWRRLAAFLLQNRRQG